MSKNTILKIVLSIVPLLIGIGGGYALFSYINESTNIQNNSGSVNIKNGEENTNSVSPTINIENNNNPIVAPTFENQLHFKEQPSVSRQSESTIKKLNKEEDARNRIKLLKQQYIDLLQGNINKTDCEAQKTNRLEKLILDDIESIAKANNIYSEYKTYLERARRSTSSIIVLCNYESSSSPIVF